jgi:hypothetical protein
MIKVSWVIFLLFFFSLSLSAEEDDTGLQHIVPLYESAVHLSQLNTTAKSCPLPYNFNRLTLRAEVPEETNLPTLLGPDLYKVKDVCGDAKLKSRKKLTDLCRDPKSQRQNSIKNLCNEFHNGATKKVSEVCANPVFDILENIKSLCQNAKGKGTINLKNEHVLTRRYAVVLKKGHLCDLTMRYCLIAFRAFADPCNKFVQDNFIPYHAKTFSVKKVGNKTVNVPTKVGPKIDSIYSSLGPMMRLIDLQTCKLTSRTYTSGFDIVPPGKAAYSVQEKGKKKKTHVLKQESRLARIKAMRNSLLYSDPAVGSKLNQPQSITACSDEELANSKKNLGQDNVDTIKTLIDNQFQQL